MEEGFSSAESLMRSKDWYKVPVYGAVCVSVCLSIILKLSEAEGL
jgi:hypothetical protein